MSVRSARRSFGTTNSTATFVKEISDMTVTVTANLVDTAAGWVTAGDGTGFRHRYYRRFHLSCTGSAGRSARSCSEIYDSTAVPFKPTPTR
jgi:hypothetical protein